MYAAHVSAVPAEQVEAGAENVQIRWLIDKAKGAPHFAMRHFRIGPHGYTPHHEHPWEHEVYVLGGAGVVVSSAGERPLCAGDCVLLEPNERHQFRSSGEDVLEVLCLVPNHSY
jgi:quercetin dioxygenase-like cupin family protein